MNETTEHHNKPMPWLPLKKVLTMDELVVYSGLKRSYLYQLVRTGMIPYSKPRRNLYFDREKIDQWLLTNEHEPKPQKR
jgi:prophage regulatory protein